MRSGPSGYRWEWVWSVKALARVIVYISNSFCFHHTVMDALLHQDRSDQVLSLLHENYFPQNRQWQWKRARLENQHSWPRHISGKLLKTSSIISFYNRARRSTNSLTIKNNQSPFMGKTEIGENSCLFAPLNNGFLSMFAYPKVLLLLFWSVIQLTSLFFRTCRHNKTQSLAIQGEDWNRSVFTLSDSICCQK